jgi:hypothetical protein
MSHLFNVVGSVAFLLLDPLIEGSLAVAGMRGSVQPYRPSDRDEESICHFSQAADNPKSLPSTLVKVVECICPPLRIEFQCRATRLGSKAATAHIGAGFATREVQDGFMDAPAILRNFVEPHFLWKLPERSRKQRWRAAERFKFLSSLLTRHDTLLQSSIG